jgi:hypothetical protein
MDLKEVDQRPAETFAELDARATGELDGRPGIREQPGSCVDDARVARGI